MHRTIVRPSAFVTLSALLALGACDDERSITDLPATPVPAVVALTLTPATVTVPYLGATTLLTADLRNTKGQAVDPPRVFWLSLDTSVARVDSAGLVTGVAVGSTKVVAQFLELADTADVTVARVPVAMTLSLNTLLVTELGRTIRVEAEVWDGSGSRIPAPAVVWTSSASSVVSVDAQGTLKALADGTAVITATADTVVRTVSVRVASRPASLQVTPSSISMDGVSDTSRVVSVVRNAAGVSMHPLLPTYTSSDTTVATVDFIGFVIARKAGSAVIRVTADTLSATVPVTVTQTTHSVLIVPDTATVAVGGTKTYVALVKDRFAVAIPGAAVAWTSSDTTVATVDAAGVVTGKATGTATLTATSSSRSDSAKVTVVAPAPAG